MKVSNDFDSLLKKAIGGDQLALRKILQLYQPLIAKASTINGFRDEDLIQRIESRIAMGIAQKVFENFQ